MTVTKKTKQIHFFEGVGRRKSTIARLRLYLPNKEKIAMVSGKKLKQGEIIVNDNPLSSVFSNPSEKIRVLMPLKLTECEDRFVLSAKMYGGGKRGWVDAFVLACSRALVQVEPSYRSVLKHAGLLHRDARVRERRKVGTGGKSRRAKQSPKR